MRSLLVVMVLAAAALAGPDPLVSRVAGHTYEVTATYVSGPPPDCGSTSRGHRQCPAPQTTTVTRVVKVEAKDVRISERIGNHGTIRCAELQILPSPDPKMPHLQGEQMARPRDGGPALPLCNG